MESKQLCTKIPKKSIKQVPQSSSLPHYMCTGYSPDHTMWGLICINRFEGCLFSYSYSTTWQAVPCFFAFWTEYTTSRSFSTTNPWDIHKVFNSNSFSTMKQGHENLTILGNWLIVSPPQEQTGGDTTIHLILVNDLFLTVNYIKGSFTLGRFSVGLVDFWYCCYLFIMCLVLFIY